MKSWIISVIAGLSLAACATPPVTKPDVITFSAPQSEMRAALETECSEIEERVIEPARIPEATSHTQIDCIGFDYFGAPRVAEFVFADDALILVWILVDETELPDLEAAFTRTFGPASFTGEEVVGFFENFAAVRKDVPEALYYSQDVSELVEQRIAR